MNNPQIYLCRKKNYSLLEKILIFLKIKKRQKLQISESCMVHYRTRASNFVNKNRIEFYPKTLSNVNEEELLHIINHEFMHNILNRNGLINESWCLDNVEDYGWWVN